MKKLATEARRHGGKKREREWRAGEKELNDSIGLFLCSSPSPLSSPSSPLPSSNPIPAYILRVSVPLWFVFVAAAVAAVSCARKAPEKPAPPVAYPYSSSAPWIFYAGPLGLQDSAPAALEPALSSRAPNASVMSADASSIAVAVNLWGLERVIASPERSSYRLEGEPMMEAFAGLSTGGAWPSRKGFLVQLYRDPFASADEEAGQGAAGSPDPAPEGRLALFGPSGGENIALPSISALAPGYELFVLLPSLSSWYAELPERRGGQCRHAVLRSRRHPRSSRPGPRGQASRVRRGPEASAPGG